MMNEVELRRMQKMREAGPRTIKNPKMREAMRLLSEGMQQAPYLPVMGPAMFGALMLMLGGEGGTEEQLKMWDQEDR